MPATGAPTEQYFTVDQCTGCGTEVHGIHGRWACPNCSTCSPYREPPEGWQGEITPEEKANRTVGYDRR